MYEINVIWTDGTSEKIRSISVPAVRDGTLNIETGRRERRVIPLTSLREWTWKEA